MSNRSLSILASPITSPSLHSALVGPLLICVSLFSAIPLLSTSVFAQNGCEYPHVLMIVDRSTSMRGQIDGQTKWDLASTAIEAMLSEFSLTAEFGLMLYPGPSGSGAQGVEGTVDACRVNQQDDVCTPQRPRCTTGEVVVDVALNTEQSIQDAMIWPDALSHSYTPTWQSIEAASQYQPLIQDTQDNYAILLTDGWQCCGVYNNGTRCEAEPRSLPVDKIRELKEAGVTPFIIGFGGSVDVTTLQRMAIEAGTAKAGCDPEATDINSPLLCYYQASEPQTLNIFLNEIGRQISDEVCDGLDNDCDGSTDENLTQRCTSSCGEGVAQCERGAWGDCNAPQASEESCNEFDDDCDGQIDEGLSRPCQTACGIGSERCVDGAWASCDAPPELEESCNRLDDNCDGQVDEGCECIDGDRQVCGSDIGSCQQGNQTCAQEMWGACVGQLTAQEETCNGLDDDCDGSTDEGLTQACSSACGEGMSACEGGQWTACSAPDVPEEQCNGLDDDCDGVQDEGDLCDGGLACRCGGCAPPCSMNECSNGGLCVDGICETDQCPSGMHCEDSLCADGERPAEDPDPMMSEGESMPDEMQDLNQGKTQSTEGCQSHTQSVTPGLLIFLGLLSIFTRRRRQDAL
jgi:hypothetical protein